MPVPVLIQMLEAGKSVLGKVKAVVTGRAIAQVGAGGGSSRRAQ